MKDKYVEERLRLWLHWQAQKKVQSFKVKGSLFGKVQYFVYIDRKKNLTKVQYFVYVDRKNT